MTGSRFLVRSNGQNLLVECGLFQGGHDLEDKNWQPFPVPPGQIEAVILTHAHLDHVGYLPRLVGQGFGGPIYATGATCALMQLVLMDAGHLQEQEAAYANRAGYSRHKPALPLFTQYEAALALERLRPVTFDDPLSLGGVTAVWRAAGHILGSASIELTVNSAGASRLLVFSGDLGRFGDPMMAPPAFVEQADTLVLESTYGDRLHGPEPDVGLEAALGRVMQSNGVLLIPAFAVGRTQRVLYSIRRLQDEGRAPDIPVIIDSPMAVDASSLYCRFGDDHNLDVNLLMEHRNCPLRCRQTRFVREVDESKQLNLLAGPAVIISASGMISGGRILHHLKHRLPDPRNEVLLVGYQAQGTRGRRLQEGAETVRIHGGEIPVRARVTSLSGLSAHADQQEILRWLRGFRRPPGQTLLVHGETPARDALGQM
ncbi:MAG: MBL fold metallo-hydrolase RNA specificity domain-containing protein, partial [Anaerolineales bacterium]